MSLLGSIYHSSNKNMEESKEKNFSSETMMSYSDVIK